MRAFLKNKDGASMVVYANKEYWKKCDCGIKTHKHKTPLEAFKCWVKHSGEFSGYKLIWVKDR